MFEDQRIAPDVELRILLTEDAAKLTDAYQRNREHLTPWEPTRPEEFFTERFQREDIVRRLIATKTEEGFPLALVSSNEIVGRFNLAGITRGPFQSAGLGYWVDRNHLGRGLAGAAVRAIVKEARDKLGPEYNLHILESFAKHVASALGWRPNWEGPVEG